MPTVIGSTKEEFDRKFMEQRGLLKSTGAMTRVPTFSDTFNSNSLKSFGKYVKNNANTYLDKLSTRKGIQEEALGSHGLSGVGGLAGTFIGKGSKTWNVASHNKALDMAKNDVDERKIWAETGNFIGADGKWRQEISDDLSKFNTQKDLTEKVKEINLENQNLKTLVAPVKNQKDLFPKLLTEARRPYKEQIKQNVNLLNKNYGLKEDVYRGNYANLAFEHPEIYQSYPDMEKIVISQGWNKGEGNFGAYIPSKNFVSDNLQVNRAALERKSPEWGGKSTALHEMQHAVQEREGFATGGSVNELQQNLLNERNQLNNQITELNNKMSELARVDKMSPQAQSAYDMLMEQRMQLVPRVQQLQDNDYIAQEAFRQYKNLTGEAESRATQARMDMTPISRLMTFPFDSYDVPRNDLINKFTE